MRLKKNRAGGKLWRWEMEKVGQQTWCGGWEK